MNLHRDQVGPSIPNPSMPPSQPGQQPPAFYGAPPPQQQAPVPIPAEGGGAFNNQLPNMYAQQSQQPQQPPVPAMATPDQQTVTEGAETGIRKAEDEAEGQTDAKRQRVDNNEPITSDTGAAPVPVAANTTPVSTTPVTPVTPTATPTPPTNTTPIPVTTTPLANNTRPNIPLTGSNATAWSDQTTVSKKKLKCEKKQNAINEIY